jgi:hypothetical protein
MVIVISICLDRGAETQARPAKLFAVTVRRAEKTQKRIGLIMP